MIRCEGAAEMGDRLDDVADAIARNLTETVESEANALRAEAKRRCPVDTGRLRDSIQAGVQARGAGIEVTIGSELEYAAPVELGTLACLPKPYLAPAFRARRNALIEHVKRAVRRALRGERE